MSRTPSTHAVTRSLIVDRAGDRRRLRSFRLRVEAPGQAPQVVECRELRLRVGTQKAADLRIEDPAISRLHFEIQVDDHGYRLFDLGSTNGTFVDGYRVRDIYLRPASEIRVGGTRIHFELGTDEADVPIFRGEVFGGIVGKSLVMRELFAVLDKAARSSATVLVQGESGTGKELVARALHRQSGRSGPLVVVDCGALPGNLIESVLFGHEKGAFTGAAERRLGQLEEAEGGTVFLDEIGELPLEVQPKLLRVLEARQIRRVGGRRSIDLDVRIVAATHRDLAAEVNRGAFREDLYYRLAVVRVDVPALRDRRDDIPLLVEHFIRSALAPDRKKIGAALESITEAHWMRLRAHPWPGNVRELRNVIERSLALGVEADVDPRPREAQGPIEVDLDQPYSAHKAAWLRRFDRAYVLGQLERHDGNISRAARASGLERMHFKRIAKKLE
ncbi:MAG: sigma 54-interacting transcriptional regulator [Myxococcota bacterium]